MANIDDKMVEGNGKLLDLSKRNRPLCANKEVASECFVKVFTVTSNEKDRYCRYLGKVYSESKCLNGELSGNGIEWHYNQYNNWNLEEYAKSWEPGLRTDKDTFSPWEFRRAGKRISSKKIGHGVAIIETNFADILNSTKFQKASCRHAKSILIKNTVEFEDKEEDLKAGYEACKFLKTLKWENEIGLFDF